MKKQYKKRGGKSPRRWNTRTLVIAAAAALAVVIAVVALALRPSAALRDYRAKAETLRAAVIGSADELVPADGAGYAVFLSLCDGTARASVVHGTGDTPEKAWRAANADAEELVRDGLAPVWVKADAVCETESVTAETLGKRIVSARHEFFRYGLAFDGAFGTALLEAELNGFKIYEYDEGGIDQQYLNNYLRRAGRDTVETLPENYTLFRCLGWFCGEDGTLLPLSGDGLTTGRREIELIDAAYAAELIENASGFLLAQIKDDGSFVYGYYPRFDNRIENYNIVRHASTIWSLICRYRMTGDAALAEQIEKTLDYLLTQVIYASPDTAYLYEEKDDEIKLGGCGVAVIAMTEYMDAAGSTRYEEVCRALGNGILTMFDRETGEYYHILNGDFTRKEAFRTVYYDGEATFALARLYALTGEAIWLDAACTAVDHFIEADYTQYRDHWIAYSLNEVTKHVTDRPDYFAFALRNASDNWDAIAERDTTYHTYLELLMSTFELYDRMEDKPADFDIERLLEVIYTRADRQLNGYFYPEYAMYMANPRRILDTFMVRHDGYRVRIDDVQHNIGGYYLYYKNYDRMVSYGLTEAAGAVREG